MIGLTSRVGCCQRCAGSIARACGTLRVLPESGGTWLLPRIIGWSRAAEIMFTGRTLDAAQCLEAGIVSRVVPAAELMDECGSLAREIASNAPLAVQATKRMMRMGNDETFEANVHHVFLQLLPLVRTKDFREGVSASLEKREPKFEGR